MCPGAHASAHVSAELHAKPGAHAGDYGHSDARPFVRLQCATLKARSGSGGGGLWNSNSSSFSLVGRSPPSWLTLHPLFHSHAPRLEMLRERDRNEETSQVKNYFLGIYGASKSTY